MKTNKKNGYRPRDKSRKPLIYKSIAITLEDKAKLATLSRETGLSMAQLFTVAVNSLPMVLTAMGRTATQQQQPASNDSEASNAIV